ncbi:DUF3857 domain-containing protein [uncultured Formosa sp.]|uniref:DUF3857 domain-containing protein n=1 Tax=uncultured Formosa sp. TaxID=255435 RepID=UPI00262DE491|nr:DUF3857 domain-containing protein [uncultured Formosa sp.]
MMYLKSYLGIFILCLTTNVFAQTNFSSNILEKATIGKNANALVKTNEVEIHIQAYNKMLVKSHRTVTIYNETGDSKGQAYEYYDETTKIKTLEATVYNAKGEKIKRYKEKDFLDVAAVDGISIYNDNRVKYLKYAAIDYPYTIDYISEVEHKMTAFIPSWSPLEGHYTGVKKSSYQIFNETDIPLAVKEEHLEDYNIKKVGDYHYVAEDLLAIKPEALSPEFHAYAPRVKVAMQTFDMKGIQGVNTSWNDFGKWMYNNLLVDTRTLPESVKTEIKALTKDASSDIEKAKIVYEYLQVKTRYISVQVGIGGWKPMLAEDVDRLSYGDCKGLSNYTKALLDVVGVPSYYAVIYGGKNIRNFDREFSATEGNHAVLTIPNGDNYIWLECTSQKTPFGYVANFTDDRDALVITPEGGKIIHTTVYETSENVLATSAEINLNLKGGFSSQVEMKSYGSQYRGSDGLEEDPEKDQKLRFKNMWDNVNDLVVESFQFTNDKNEVVFTENVKVSAKLYASKTGNRLLLVPNIFNKLSHIPPRYSKRTMSVEIDRGFLDQDEYVFHLEKGLQVEALQPPISIETKFGSYAISIEDLGDGKLRYKRKLKLEKGTYPKEDYKAYRDFWVSISKYDNSKVVLQTKTTN